MKPPSSATQIRKLKLCGTKKVYCEDCRFFVFTYYRGCVVPILNAVKNYIEKRPNTYSVLGNFDKNENGDCEYYKHKWWKFWR